MKKTLILLSSLLVLFSCAKESAIADREAAGENSSSVPGQSLTIHASIPEGGLTKVSMEQDALNPDGAIKLAWEAEDVLTVTDASKPANSVTFTLQSGAGEKDATFTGTTPSGWTAPFNVSYSSAGKGYNYSVQTQAADGSTAHLKYVATLSGVTDLEHFAFSKAWADANSATLSSSSVLRIRVQMPDGVAAKVKCMKLKTPAAPGDEMVLNLTTPSDADGDGILNLYLTIPAGDIALPEGTPVALVFDTEDSDSFVRIHKFTAESSILSGRVNALKFNCKSLVNSASECVIPGDGSSAYPYLIGDKFQLSAVALLLADDVVTSIKMVDDVDMKDVPWTHLNTGSGYKQIVDFDGNNKTISNLSKNLFYVFKGSVKDLTLDHSVVKARGIFAEYCQGTGNTITNVNITNGKVNSSSSNVGGLIGQINNDPISGSTVATITNCSVSGTDVTGAGVVGGLVGYANELVSISGCTYTGGKVTASARWSGGLIGSTGDYASVITDCHVTDAEVASSSDRVGGCVGQIGQKGVTFKGCTVGTSANKVAVSSTLSGATVNLGGFAGVCYGTVTKNGDVRSETHVTISSSNTNTGKYVNIGGFVGYLEKGTVEYSDAEATISGIKGHQVGGFAAVLTSGGPCKVDNCTANATVSGNNYVAGFIGQAAGANHVVSNNTSAGTVTGAASVAGFVGFAAQGTWTKNSTSCTVTASGANSGNFAGQLNGNITVSKCFCTGSITGNGNVCGGFTGIASNGATINDCYSTCALGGGTRKRGGIAGYVDAGTVSINRCYTTCNISNNFEMGGLVGFVGVETFTMTKCAAWNGTLVASSRGVDNWSSAACVGVAHLTCTLTDNYRNPNMDSLVYWGTNSGCGINLPNTFQHPDVSASAPLTDPNGNAVTHDNNRPYQGKCDASKTLSQLASTTLGWSADVWDFSDDLPTLK